MIRLPTIFYDKKARDGTWCRLPYPGHPKGCPNFPKCPAKHPDIQKLKGFYWYAVIEKFNLQDHAKKMAAAHPKWTERQCRNLLYWQGGVRKRLTEKAIRAADPFYEDVILKIPEASGVNVFETMAHVGIQIQRNKPGQIIKVILIGKRKEAP